MVLYDIFYLMWIGKEKRYIITAAHNEYFSRSGNSKFAIVKNINNVTFTLNKRK